MRKKTLIIVCAAVLAFALCVGILVSVLFHNLSDSDNEKTDRKHTATSEEVDTEEDVKPTPTPAPKEEVSEEPGIEDPLASNKDVDFIGDHGRDDEATRKLVKSFLEKSGVEPSKVLSVCASDFAGDGEVEAFIFTGEFVEDEYMSSYLGAYWYVKEDNSWEQKVAPEISWNDYGRFFDCGKRKFYAVTQQYTTGAPTTILTVYDGYASQVNMSGYGNVQQLEDGSFVVYHDTYDTFWDNASQFFIGHSWKPYYFYYDEAKDDMVEYESEDVSKKAINDLCGTDVLSEIKKAGAEFDSAYKRANGLVTINYSIKQADGIEYKNATWDLNKKSYVPAWGDGNSFSDSDFGGTYTRYLVEAQ